MKTIVELPIGRWVILESREDGERATALSAMPVGAYVDFRIRDRSLNKPRGTWFYALVSGSPGDEIMPIAMMVDRDGNGINFGYGHSNPSSTYSEELEALSVFLGRKLPPVSAGTSDTGVRGSIECLNLPASAPCPTPRWRAVQPSTVIENGDGTRWADMEERHGADLLSMLSGDALGKTGIETPEALASGRVCVLTETLDKRTRRPTRMPVVAYFPSDGSGPVVTGFAGLDPYVDHGERIASLAANLGVELPPSCYPDHGASVVEGIVAFGF